MKQENFRQRGSRNGLMESSSRLSTAVHSNALGKLLEYLPKA